MALAVAQLAEAEPLFSIALVRDVGFDTACFRLVPKRHELQSGSDDECASGIRIKEP